MCACVCVYERERECVRGRDWGAPRAGGGCSHTHKRGKKRRRRVPESSPSKPHSPSLPSPPSPRSRHTASGRGGGSTWVVVGTLPLFCVRVLARPMPGVLRPLDLIPPHHPPHRYVGQSLGCTIMRVFFVGALLALVVVSGELQIREKVDKGGPLPGEEGGQAHFGRAIVGNGHGWRAWLSCVVVGKMQTGVVGGGDKKDVRMCTVLPGLPPRWARGRKASPLVCSGTADASSACPYMGGEGRT